MPRMGNVPENCLRETCKRKLIPQRRGYYIRAKDVPDGCGVHAGRGLCFGCHESERKYGHLDDYPLLITRRNQRKRTSTRTPTHNWSAPQLFDLCTVDEGE